MPRGRKIGITLTDDERQVLTMWARAATTEKRYAQRAQVILSSAEGRSLPEISKKSGLSRQNCTRWRMRFLEKRVEGLKDLPRKGRPPMIAPETKTKITKLACTKPPDGSNQWTRQSLAKIVGIGKTTVHRILTQGELKPHKVEYWRRKSPDPEFEEKQVPY